MQNTRHCDTVRPGVALALKYADVQGLRGPIVYVWVRGVDVLYVGMSANGLTRPLGRHHDHLKDFRPRDLLFICPDADPARLETVLIYHLRPRLNCTPVPCPFCGSVTGEAKTCTDPEHAPDASFFLALSAF